MAIELRLILVEKLVANFVLTMFIMGKLGFVAISDHIKSKKHTSKEQTKRNKQTKRLAGKFFSQPSKPSDIATQGNQCNPKRNAYQCTIG